MRVLQQVPPIAEVDALTKKRAADWYAFFEHELTGRFQLLIADVDTRGTSNRSDTVIAVAGSEVDIKAVKTAAQQALQRDYFRYADPVFGDRRDWFVAGHYRPAQKSGQDRVGAGNGRVGGADGLVPVRW